MKARLEIPHPEDSIPMQDMKVGDFAMVLPYHDPYEVVGIGDIVTAFRLNNEEGINVLTLGNLATWDLKKCKNVRVRLLDAGERVILE